MSSPVWSSVKAALVFAGVVALSWGGVMYFASMSVPGEGWDALPVLASVATFLTAFTVWYLYVARPRKISSYRGGVAGVVIGLLVHPVTWYLFGCHTWVLSLFPNPQSGGHSDVLNPFTAVLGAVAFSLWSAACTGWITIPAGAVIGMVVGSWQERTEGKAKGYKPPEPALPDQPKPDGSDAAQSGG